MTGLPCESLATKTELTEVADGLQELRDQLNAIIGEKEDGGTQNIFQAGVGAAGAFTQLAGTAYLGTKLKALQALVDIKQVNPAFEPIYRDMANGNAQWVKVKGSGAVSRMPTMEAVTKTAGTGAAGSAAASKASAAASGGAALAMFVGNLIASVGLALANLKITSMYADANQRALELNQSTYSGLTSFLSKQNNNINQANAQIQETRSELAEQAEQTSIVSQQVEATQQDVARIRTQIQEADSRATQIEAEITSARTEIASLRADGIENMAQFESSLNDTQLQIEETRRAIVSTNARVEVVEQEIELIKEQLEEQEVRITELETTTQQWYAEFQQLKTDLEQDTELTEARVSLLESKMILAESKARTGGAGGSSLPAVNSAANTQTAVLELASQLAGSPEQVPQITTTDVQTQTTTFQDAFTNLLPQLQPGEEVNQQQLDNLRDGVKVDVQDVVNLAIGTLLIPDLVDIKDRTSERKIADATKTGICESLDGGSCPATPDNPNRTDGLKGLKDTLSDKADQISAALGLANLQQNQSILGIVKNTNDAVRSTEYGLEKIQSYASTAWKAVQGDKIMNGITTALVVHNAIMLSGNLAQTVGEAASVTLSAIGIKDEEGNPFDIGSIVQAKTDEILTNFLGTEEYEALTRRIAAANRVYQASANVLDTTHALFDSARTITELTASNTGKIGNALRDAGVVYEDAYDEMIEKVNPQNAAMRRLDRFRDGLESVEQGVSTVSSISSEVVETRENWQQLKDEKEAWKTEVDTAIQESVTAKEAEVAAVQVTADIDEGSFDAVGADES
ncbi:MAG: hypothetical protein AAGA16_07570 [Cyanobacteria bacterium P01_E01_bin.35]